MRSARTVFSVAVLSAAVAMPAGAASVSYIEQTRSVEARAGHTFDVDEDVDSESAADLGPFDASVTVSIEDLSDGDTAFASTSQSSVLGADGILASGGLNASSGGEFALSRSIVDVVFELTDPAHYSLFLDLEDTSGDEFNVDVSFQYSTTTPTLHFFRLVGDSQAVLADVTEDDILGSPYTLEHEFTGELAPGRYRFLFVGEVDNFESGGLGGWANFDYSTGLRLHDSPAVIPLPPALWAGLGMLGFMGGVRGVKRARSRRS